MLSLKSNLLHAVQKLGKPLLAPLLQILDKAVIHDHAEVAVLVFLLLYEHPELINDPAGTSLQKLCQKSYSQVTSKALIKLLNKPQNYPVKQLFDQFVESTVTLEKEQATQRSKKPIAKRR